MNSHGINEVEGKAVIVTGAATGIGRAIAELLHERGALAIAEDINPAGEDLAREGMVPFVADITHDGIAECAVGLATSRFGKLDVLVNNAGRILYKNIVDMTRKDWEWQMLNHFREDGRDFLAQHGKTAPIGRAAKPQEIAEIVAFLASDRASFMVGSIVMADGGASVQIG
jgi:NAD(P)-dependent dehydrogenase (short-subunit alcohol dehydrogenase family)